MFSPPRLSSLARKAACDLLGLLTELGLDGVPVSEEVRAADVVVRVVVEPVERPTESPPGRDARPTESLLALEEDDLRVLRALVAGELLGKEVAGRLHVPYGSPLRARLSRLKRLGLITNPGRGYRLTDQGRRLTKP